MNLKILKILVSYPQLDLDKDTLQHKSSMSAMTQTEMLVSTSRILSYLPAPSCAQKLRQWQVQRN